VPCSRGAIVYPGLKKSRGMDCRRLSALTWLLKAGCSLHMHLEAKALSSERRGKTLAMKLTAPYKVTLLASPATMFPGSIAQSYIILLAYNILLTEYLKLTYEIMNIRFSGFFVFIFLY
jgi:hypothetical protein